MVAALLLALLTLDLLHAAPPCPQGAAGPAPALSLTRLRVCGAADLAPGSRGEQSTLRSEAPPPPAPARRLAATPSPTRIPLPDGHPLPVERPPRRRA